MRFVIEGGGIFWIRDRYGRLVAIEVQPGDMIRVPDVYIAQGPAYPRHPAVSEPGGRTRTTPPRRRKRLKTMRAVPLDREGAVCPIHFVSSQLFPSVPEHVDEWVHAHSTDAAVQQLAGQVARQRSDGDPADSVRGSVWQGPFPISRILFLPEDCDRVKTPVRNKKPYFRMDPAFDKAFVQ